MTEIADRVGFLALNSDLKKCPVRLGVICIIFLCGPQLFFRVRRRTQNLYIERVADKYGVTLCIFPYFVTVS